MATTRAQDLISSPEVHQVFRWTVLIAAILASVVGCAPPFAELQSARLVGVGHRDVTASLATVNATSSESSGENVQTELAAQAAFGVSPKTDIRARYDYISTANGGSFHALSAGPKFGLVKDAIALYVPVGFGWGGETESAKTWVLNPTLLATSRVNRQVEVTGSTKYYLWLNNSNESKLFAWNLGLGLSSDLDRWAIRPEFGFLHDIKDSGHNTQFSLGLTIRQ